MKAALILTLVLLSVASPEARRLNSQERAAQSNCTTLWRQEPKLCVAQTYSAIEKVSVCDDYKPQCVKDVEKTMMVRGRDGDELNLSAWAACKRLGFAQVGGGSVYTVGGMQELCHNGQRFMKDNYWDKLVCCR